MHNLTRPAFANRLWWQLGGFVAVSAFSVWVSFSWEHELSLWLPETGILRSTFNAKPSGYQGFYRLVRRLGIKCSRWRLPYRCLDGQGGILLVIEPSEPLAPFAVDQILNWVARGNKLIYLEECNFSFYHHGLIADHPLLDRLGLKADVGRAVRDEHVAPRPDRPEYEHVSGLLLSARGRLRGGRSLLSDAFGALAVEVKHGRGSVVFGFTPAMCANGNLRSRSFWPNFQFLSNCLAQAGGEVYFDEACHGYSQGINVFAALASGPLGIIILQAVLVLIVGVLSASQRFGWTKEVASTRRISSLEFVDGMAATLQRAAAGALAWEILNRSFRQALARQLGVSPQSSDQEMVTAWIGHELEHPEQFRAFLAHAGATANDRLTNDKLSQLVAHGDQMLSAASHPPAINIKN